MVYTLPTIVSGSVVTKYFDGTKTNAITITGTPQAGDIVVLVVNQVSAAGNPTSMSAWTQQANVVTGSRQSLLFTKTWAAGETSYSYVMTTSTGGEADAVMFLVRGVASISPGTFKLRATATAETVTTTGLSITTTIANTLVLGFNWEATSATEANTPTLNSGWTQLTLIPQNAAPIIEQILVSQKAMATAGATGNQVATWPNTQASNGAGLLVAFVPPDVAVAPTVAISSPAAGATVSNPRTVFSGTVTSGATVVLTNGAGTSLGSVVSSDGTWSITPTADLTSGTATYTVTATLSSQTATATVSVTYTAAGHSPSKIWDGTNLRNGAWQWWDGTAQKLGYWQWWDGSVQKDISQITIVYPGRKISRLFTGTQVPVIAHRCGSANFMEHTLRGATQSAIAHVDALEISVACTSDNVLIGLHDASLDRTSNNTGGGTGTNLVVSSMTWAQVQTYQQNYPVGNNTPFGAGPYPYYRISDLIAPYAKTHSIFIDPKALSTTQRQNVLYPYLQSFENYKDTFALKFYHTGTTIADEATALGLSSWGYGYQADVDGTGPTQMSTTQAKWTWLGMDYGASAAAWSTVMSYGKRVLGHICPTYAAAQTAIGYGASGIMASGVVEVTAGLGR